ncbi:MAG TPA: glutamate formimidoyltransferase [Anaerolineaceae bacterium]|nr:glutamate formimidoyltransferase [Anaerolineaceae bacterium]
MPGKIVECIPNFSDARRPEVVKQIVEAVAAVEGIRILDTHSDTDHNRTVLTFVGDPSAVEEAAYRGIAKATELIDLNQHQGEHPRIGATDVVPFVPISGVAMTECIEMAKRLGKRVADELHIPIYFYEDAAIRQDRRNLEDIRKGEFEGLKQVIATDPYREPDLGPKALGTAGATVIGARQPLIAYNIYLTTSDVSIAEKIARRVRNSTGGFRFVKAMGVLVNGLAQVSMNLTNFKRSPMAQVTEFVRREAERYGVGIHHSELVGLIPQRALSNAAQYYLQLDDFDYEQILENKLFSGEPNHSGENSLEKADFIEAVSEGTPAPGGGSAAAHTGALAAALAVMVARLTVGKAKYAGVEAECWQIIEIGEHLRKELEAAVVLDAEAFDGILKARRLPKDTEEMQTKRQAAMRGATLEAARVPLMNAGKCVEVMRLALRMAEIGNINAISDAGAGVNLGKAAFEAAAMNVRINLLGIEEEAEPAKMLEELYALSTQASGLLEQVNLVIHERSGM